FEPFFTTKERGTGLGMAIVKKAVELVRGLIEIKSTKGKGTEVKVSIPIINNRGNNDD
ncbi:sensor histidine kinase, partial [bacterium]|nr:sensor histidine kinase [bacterium]